MRSKRGRENQYPIGAQAKQRSTSRFLSIRLQGAIRVAREREKTCTLYSFRSSRTRHLEPVVSNTALEVPYPTRTERKTQKRKNRRTHIPHKLGCVRKVKAKKRTRIYPTKTKPSLGQSTAQGRKQPDTTWEIPHSSKISRPYPSTLPSLLAMQIDNCKLEVGRWRDVQNALLVSRRTPKRERRGLGAVVQVKRRRESKTRSSVLCPFSLSLDRPGGET